MPGPSGIPEVHATETAVRAALSAIDEAPTHLTGAVALLTGLTCAELDELGGVTG